MTKSRSPNIKDTPTKATHYPGNLNIRVEKGRMSFCKPHETISLTPDQLKIEKVPRTAYKYEEVWHQDKSLIVLLFDRNNNLLAETRRLQDRL